MGESKYDQAMLIDHYESKYDEAMEALDEIRRLVQREYSYRARGRKLMFANKQFPSNEHEYLAVKIIKDKVNEIIKKVKQ